MALWQTLHGSRATTMPVALLLLLANALAATLPRPADAQVPVIAADGTATQPSAQAPCDATNEDVCK